MSDSFRRVFVFVLNGGHIYFRGDTRIKAGSSVIYSVVNIVLYMGLLAGHKTQRRLLLLFFFFLTANVSRQLFFTHKPDGHHSVSA